MERRTQPSTSAVVLLSALLAATVAQPLNSSRTPAIERHCDEHVQTKYCRAHFVIKATIRAERDGDGAEWRTFGAVIKTQIKISNEFMSLPESALKTIYTPSSAPLHLISGEKYLLSGSLRLIDGAKRLVVAECDWIEPWTQLGHRHRSALRKFKFDAGCDCTISLDGDGGSAAPNECRPPRSRDASATERCFADHSHCARRDSRRRCRWVTNGELQRCLNAVR